MDPSSAEHHHQEMSCQTLESMLVCTKAQQDKKPRPAEEALKCPRCDSTNTKFCYYNNYSLTQPRYFCKSCRRYWTKGGTLRNVPVGGGCRKNKRSSSLSSSSSSLSVSSLKRGQDQAVVATNTDQNHSLTNFAYDHSDISLAIASFQKQTNGHLGFDHDHDLPILGNFYNSHCEVLGNHHHGFFDALKGGFLENPHGFQNLYYGMNSNGNTGHVGQNGGLGINANEDHMSMMPFEDNGGGATTAASTVATVKQEISCNARDGESRVLLGFPRQIGGEGNMGLDLDSGRQIWNNGFGSSWHGLLNSPLM